MTSDDNLKNENIAKPPPMKLRTARTIKWNTIDRVSSQLVYALVGVILANILTQEDFGLVGVLLIFQAFATILTDSGFGAALLRKKNPTEDDYSMVFWFNLTVSIALYALLWLCAPLIADAFHDVRLISLSKVMFTAFIINGLSIVQTNKLMKQMNVRPLAVANTVALVISGAAGIIIALAGGGAWALVWQTVLLAVIKTAIIWVAGKWRPVAVFRMSSLHEIWGIGASVLSSSLLNTICLQLYNIVIGVYYKTLSTLGVYTQADKWSKMGSASISQILTASFVPLLAVAQDDIVTFRRYITKINRFTSFILFPALGGMAAIGAPLFHTFFANKWDAAIPLFQILCVRGIFLVITSLHSNYLLSLGKARMLVIAEVIKDTLMIAAILSTIWYDSLLLIVWGQLAASVITSIAVGFLTVRATGYSFSAILRDTLPFAAIASLTCGICLVLGQLPTRMPLVTLMIELTAGVASYLLLARLLRLPELKEATNYVFGRLNSK